MDVRRSHVVLEFLTSWFRTIYHERFVMPPMTEEELKEFYRRATAYNLSTIRIIAFLILLNNILLMLVAVIITVNPSLEDYRVFIEYYRTNTIIFLGPSLTALLLIRTPKFHKVKSWHRFIDFLSLTIFMSCVVFFCLMIADSTPYFIAVTLISLTTCKSLKDMISFFFIFFILFSVGIIASDWDLKQKLIDLFEALHTVFIGIFILYIRLRSRLIRFKNNKLMVNKNRDLAEANSILKNMSMLDGLTEIPNRRSFDTHLLAEWQRAKREETPVSLLMIDIDWFKKYNDTYGHQQGDECLVQVAKKLHGIVNRIGDMVTRYGGEEFATILPNTDLKGAAAFGEKLRKAVLELCLLHSSSAWKQVTISIGVASCVPSDNSTPELLLKEADDALYHAKKKGRNRVEM